MGNHEVGPVTLRDVEHLRAHFDAGRRHGKGPKLEFFELLQVFDDRQRFASRRVVIKNIRDLFAVERAA